MTVDRRSTSYGPGLRKLGDDEERRSRAIGKRAKAAAAEEKRQTDNHMKAFKEEQDRRLDEYNAAYAKYEKGKGPRPNMPDLVNIKVPGSALGGGRRRTRRRKTRYTRRR
jgi:hypothetical protein